MSPCIKNPSRQTSDDSQLASRFRGRPHLDSSNPTRSASQSMPVEFYTSSRCTSLRLASAVSAPWPVGFRVRSKTVHIGSDHAVLDLKLIINGSRSHIRYVRCLFHQSSSGLASSKSKCHRSLAMVIRSSAHASLYGSKVSSHPRTCMIPQPKLTLFLRTTSAHAKTVDFHPCRRLQIRSRVVALATSLGRSPWGA